MSADLRRALERERVMVSAQLADYLAIHAGITSRDGNVDKPTAWSVQARALQRIIDDIEDALARMDAGTYGSCQRCGKQIPPRRRELLPHSRWCVTCVQPARAAETRK